ncbi:MAG TPA: peptidoglycan editing factor PgeF [Casimicrobiaceae bacterium]|nr:peptidoglycan editing factor PgeF [Casimicrobiaceae bacterium]
MALTRDPPLGPDAVDAHAALRARLESAGLDWIVPDWAAPGHVVALSTTKAGGVAGAFDPGSSRPSDAASPAQVATDRARLASFLPAPPVYLHQVHGTQVAVVDDAKAQRARDVPPQADAAMTRTPCIALAVRAADCLPVLFSDRAGSVVAAAHAGWRGLAAGVLEATLAAMSVAPQDVIAWIGPAIGPRAFEVGRDVLDAYVALDASDAACFVPHVAGKWLADLPGLARRRLVRAGVRDVAGGTWCTVSDAARFHSWRRERSAGRMATVIAIAPR